MLPIHHEDTNELLGYVLQESSGWSARTVFGYVMSRTVTKRDAEAIVRDKGLRVLSGVWRYFDTDEYEWFPCKLKEVYENRVIAIRTNELGFEDGDDYKRVIIKMPNETNLQIA